MGNLFGVRRRAPVVTAQDRAILQLKQQRDKIKIYQRRTETDLAKNKELAFQLFQNGMKDRALVVLRRKKYMEEILSRTDKQLETLEQLVNDIEYTQIEVSVVEGLKVGTEALKQLNNLMNIDDIQQMMEDNEEAAAKQKEISDILQRSSERYDESDLLEELAKISGEQSEEQPVEVSREPVRESDDPTSLPEVPIDMPEVPKEVPIVPETEAQKEIEGKKKSPVRAHQLEPAQ